MNSEYGSDNSEGLGEGYLVRPATETGPGVVVLHPWWGLNDFVRETCDRLADAGFVAFAPDLYDGRTATTIEDAKALRETLDHPETAERLTATTDAFASFRAVDGATIGLVGFSLGASWALRLVDRVPEVVGALVVYYGARDGEFAAAATPVLGHFAENDEFVPADERTVLVENLQAAGYDVDVHVYPGTGHWFAEPDRPDAYVPEAADEAWDRTLAFLRDHLGERGEPT